MTGLIILCVYLTGFAITGRWAVRADIREGREPVLIDALCAALTWPVVALIFGVSWVLAWLFGITP